MESPQEYKFKVVGTRPIRHDGIDKVTGRARYGADISLPGMLHAKVLRSPHAHARIKSIDASAARALPGVKAVITGQDLPELASGIYQMGEIPVNPRYLSMNIMARDKVLYNGHAVAAVAATSPHIAEEALALIKLEYELLPLALRLSRKTGKPVSMVMNRCEVLRATGATSGSHMRCKMGATKGGKITAAHVCMA